MKKRINFGVQYDLNENRHVTPSRNRECKLFPPFEEMNNPRSRLMSRIERVAFPRTRKRIRVFVVCRVRAVEQKRKTRWRIARACTHDTYDTMDFVIALTHLIYYEGKCWLSLSKRQIKKKSDVTKTARRDSPKPCLLSVRQHRMFCLLRKFIIFSGQKNCETDYNTVIRDGSSKSCAPWNYENRV